MYFLCPCRERSDVSISKNHRLPLRRFPRAPLFWAVCILAFGFAPTIHAQTAPTLVTRFERDVNRYVYVATLSFADHSIGPWRASALLRAATEAFGRSDDLLFRDEGTAVLTASRPVRENVRVGFRSETAGFSQGRVARHLSGLTLSIAPPDASWSIEGLAGVGVDQRPGAITPMGGEAPLRTDAGPTAGFTALLARPAGTYALAGRAGANWQNLLPRRHGDAAVDLRLTPGDDAVVPISADLALRRSLRGTYQSASFLNRTGTQPGGDFSSSRIEETTLDTLLAGATLAAPLLRDATALRLDGRLEGEALARSVRTSNADPDALFFDTDFARRSVRLDLRMSANRARWDGHAGLRASATVEDRTLANRSELPPAQAAQKAALLEQADYEQSTLGADVRIARTARTLTVFAEAQASLLRLDTPEANADDRDEAFASARLGAEWRVSPRLLVDVQAFGSDYHTVYLRASRSGENSRQRAVRLRPGTTWTPRMGTRARLEGEVRATYTRDDFRLPGRPPSDQSAREQRLSLDAEHALAPTLRFYATATASDLRLGRLLPDRFAEVPFDTVRTYDAHLRLVADRTWRAELGVRVFYRTDYSPAITTRFARADGATAAVTRPGITWLRQLGPTASLSIPIGARGSSVELSGWYAIQQQAARLYGRLDEANEAAIRRAAGDAPARLLPRVTFGVVWRL